MRPVYYMYTPVACTPCGNAWGNAAAAEQAAAAEVSLTQQLCGTNLNHWKLTQALWNLMKVLALLSLSELLHFKPNFKNGLLVCYIPFIYTDTQQGPCYSQPSGNYHSEGWTIVRYYELMTAPSYIHAKRCSHASLLARSSHVRDHKGAYAHAYTTI